MINTFGAEEWFAESGINRPNKRVKEAQKDCPYFEVREFWKIKAERMKDKPVFNKGGQPDRG